MSSLVFMGGIIRRVWSHAAMSGEARQSKSISESRVRFAAVGDDQDDHDAVIIADFIDNSIIPDANAPEGVVPLQLDRPSRPRVLCERVDAHLNLKLPVPGN